MAAVINMASLFILPYVNVLVPTQTMFYTLDEIAEMQPIVWILILLPTGYFMGMIICQLLMCKIDWFFILPIVGILLQYILFWYGDNQLESYWKLFLVIEKGWGFYVSMACYILMFLYPAKSFYKNRIKKA